MQNLQDRVKQVLEPATAVVLAKGASAGGSGLVPTFISGQLFQGQHSAQGRHLVWVVQLI